MFGDKINIVGKIASTTTSEHVTYPQDDVGMTSTGSTMELQAICIFILTCQMLVILKGNHAISNY